MTENFFFFFFFFLNAEKIKPTLLLEILNSIFSAIQLTMKASEKQLPFLDIMIHKDKKYMDGVSIKMIRSSTFLFIPFTLKTTLKHTVLSEEKNLYNCRNLQH